MSLGNTIIRKLPNGDFVIFRGKNKKVFRIVITKEQAERAVAKLRKSLANSDKNFFLPAKERESNTFVFR